MQHTPPGTSWLTSVHTLLPPAGHAALIFNQMCGRPGGADWHIFTQSSLKYVLLMLRASCCQTGMQGAKSKYMQELQKERDTLAKEKTALLQKLAAVTQAGAEERKRLEQTYKDKLTSVEKRLRDLAEREKAAKRNAAQLVR